MKRVHLTACLPLFLVLVRSAAATTTGFGLDLESLIPPTASPVDPQVTTAGRGSDSREKEPRIADDRLRRSGPDIDLYPTPDIYTLPRAFPARVPGDFAAMVKAPLAWDGRNWRRFGIGVAAVGAVALFDDEINNWMDENRTNGAVQAAETIRPLGQHGAFILLGATWLAGRHFDQPKVTAVAADGFESALFAAGIITPILKAVTGRIRPRGTDNSGDFGGSGKSFPSGETTLAFSIASVVAAHSDRKWVDGVAWGAAGLIGVQRMVLDGHWASDVVAGALIGTAVGQWMVRRNRPELEPAVQFDIAPTIDSDSYGVSVHLRF